jgi:hypothetical protein
MPCFSAKSVEFPVAPRIEHAAAGDDHRLFRLLDERDACRKFVSSGGGGAASRPSLAKKLSG